MTEGQKMIKKELNEKLHLLMEKKKFYDQKMDGVIKEINKIHQKLNALGK